MESVSLLTIIKRALRQAVSLSLFIKHYKCESLENMLKVKKTKLMLIEKIEVISSMIKEKDKKDYFLNAAISLKNENKCSQLSNSLRILKKVFTEIIDKESTNES